MKNRLKVIAGLICSIALFSCEQTIKLDLKQFDSNVVIEGMVTNRQGTQYVKLTRTTDFYSNTEAPRITDATVSITDDENNTYLFVHNPENKADFEGIYLPETPFEGVIGRTYSLSVLIDGKNYDAHDKLNAVTSVDSVAFKIDEEEQKDPSKKGKFYRTLIYAKEPKATVDFYLFKSYRNDTLVFDNEHDVYISDDVNIAENIDGIDGAGYFGMGDTATVQFSSLNHDAYLYYADLANLLQNSGGIFGSPPANIRTNLSNGALGFFQVSAISSRTAILKGN